MKDYNAIKKVIDNINLGKDSDALQSFESFLNGTQDGASYHAWTRQCVEVIYNFGSLFTTKNPEEFLSMLNVFSEKNEKKREVVDFIYSEIVWNYFSQDRIFVKNLLQDLKKKYPLNPEFYHTYSHVLEQNGNFNESLNILEQAIKMDPCETYVNAYINRVRIFFNRLIAKNGITEAERVLSNATQVFSKIPNNIRFATYLNILAQLEDRLGDHRAIEEKISKIDEIIIKKTEALRNRFISLLGIFTAVIAFILTTTNIAISKLEPSNVMLIMFAMANVLIIFSISIDYIFHIRRKRKHFFEFLLDKQFWAIIILLFVLFFLYKSA